jgi:hypothetical protein
MDVKRGLRRWARWFESPGHRWLVGGTVIVIGLALAAIGFSARDEVVGGPPSAGTATALFWIGGGALFLAGLVVLVLPPFLLKLQPSTNARTLFSKTNTRPVETAGGEGSAHDAPVQAEESEWVAYCDPPGDALVFVLRHAHDNAGAVLAFGDFECTVNEPSGGPPLFATGHSIWHPRASWCTAQYDPAYFEGAPPLASGMYKYRWRGMDDKGRWQLLASGECVVSLPKTKTPRVIPPMLQVRAPGVGRHSLTTWNDRHRVESDGQVPVEIWTTQQDRQILRDCTVKAPGQERGAKAVPSPAGLQAFYSFTYPRDFDESIPLPLAPGEYAVEWTAVAGSLIRLHAFNIPEHPYEPPDSAGTAVHGGQSIENIATPSVPQTPFRAPHNGRDLAVRILSDQFRPFGEALIVEGRLKIENLAERTKYVSGLGFGTKPPWNVGGTSPDISDVLLEVGRVGREWAEEGIAFKGGTAIERGASVMFPFVGAVRLQIFSSEYPEYRVTVQDELQCVYGAIRKSEFDTGDVPQ